MGGYETAESSGAVRKSPVRTETKSLNYGAVDNHVPPATQVILGCHRSPTMSPPSNLNINQSPDQCLGEPEKTPNLSRVYFPQWPGIFLSGEFMKREDVISFIRSNPILSNLKDSEIDSLASSLQDFLLSAPNTKFAPGAEPAPKWLQNSLRSLMPLVNEVPVHHELKYRISNIVTCMEYHDEFSKRSLDFIKYSTPARFLHWKGGKNESPTREDVVRTFEELSTSDVKKSGYWAEGEGLVPESEFVRVKQERNHLRLKLADMQEVCRRAYNIIDESYHKLLDREGFGPLSIRTDLEKAAKGNPPESVTMLNEKLSKGLSISMKKNRDLKKALGWAKRTIEWLSDPENDGGVSTCKKHNGYGFTSDCAICEKLEEIKKLLSDQWAK